MAHREAGKSAQQDDKEKEITFKQSEVYRMTMYVDILFESAVWSGINDGYLGLLHESNRLCKMACFLKIMASTL